MEQWTARAVPVHQGAWRCRRISTRTRVALWPAGVLPLLDVHDPVRRGGTGHPVDWDLAARVARRRPVMLAGGLRPENIEDAIARVAPYAVDVSSGVEDRPGIKNPARIRTFMEAVARADAREGR